MLLWLVYKSFSRTYPKAILKKKCYIVKAFGTFKIGSAYHNRSIFEIDLFVEFGEEWMCERTSLDKIHNNR